MEQALIRFLTWVLILAVLPATAEQTIDKMARMVTENGGQAECLAPVTINKIDGVKRAMPAPGFLIEPGVHTVNGRAQLDTTKCRPLDGNQQITGVADLEVNFEAGKTYYIVYDRSHPNTDEWKLIVWKVEQAGPPGSQFQPLDGHSLPITENIQ